jgi:hypothetical protein
MGQSTKEETQMRKLVLVLCVLAILPVAAFAEWGIGGAAFYKSPVLLGSQSTPAT